MAQGEGCGPCRVPPFPSSILSLLSEGPSQGLKEQLKGDVTLQVRAMSTALVCGSLDISGSHELPTCPGRGSPKQAALIQTGKIKKSRLLSIFNKAHSSCEDIACRTPRAGVWEGKEGVRKGRTVLYFQDCNPPTTSRSLLFGAEGGRTSAAPGFRSSVTSLVVPPSDL